MLLLLRGGKGIWGHVSCAKLRLPCVWLAIVLHRTHAASVSVTLRWWPSH